MKFKYGDLVTSEAHLPQARGPYLVLHQMNRYLVCVSLDNNHSINILVDKAEMFYIDAKILKILIDRTPVL
jgi:hypothetical protein